MAIRGKPICCLFEMELDIVKTPTIPGFRIIGEQLVITTAYAFDVVPDTLRS